MKWNIQKQNKLQVELLKRKATLVECYLTIKKNRQLLSFNGIVHILQCKSIVILQ